jgi:hypothetical protein
MLGAEVKTPIFFLSHEHHVKWLETHTAILVLLPQPLMIKKEKLSIVPTRVGIPLREPIMVFQKVDNR